MKRLCIVWLPISLVLVGCASGGGLARPTVSEAAVLEYLEIVERGHFHRMALEGQEVFTEGAYVPNYAELFERFPYSEPQPGHIRYSLYSFSGKASAGEVYLILERESGRIVEFSFVEASF